MSVSYWESPPTVSAWSRDPCPNNIGYSSANNANNDHNDDPCPNNSDYSSANNANNDDNYDNSCSYHHCQAS